MSERTAYVALREGLCLASGRLDRIENLVGTGYPDVNGCINGNEFWIENKAPSEPKRKTTPLFGSNHRLSVEQRNWFLRQRRAGGKGYIYIETESKRLLISGRHADEINEATLLELIAMSTWQSDRPTKPKEWGALRAILAGGIE